MSTNDDRGWVRPVTHDGDAVAIDPIEPTGRTLRSSVVSGIILVAVVATAIAGVVLWRNRTGDPFASARSIPADMDFVMTFDALALSDSERLQSFVDAFAIPMVDAGLIEDYPDDLVAAIDESLDSGSGFTLSDDVFPWIGRSVSVAANVPLFDPISYGVDEASFLMTADVRDRAAAAAFVDKIVTELTDNGVEIAATEVAGLPGYRFSDDYAEFSLVLVLAEDTLLYGLEGDVVGAFAAREAGLSIAEDATFQATMDRIPGDSMVKVFVSSGLVDGFAELTSAMLPPGTDTETPEEFFEAMGIGAGLVDEGLRVNYVMVGVEDTGDLVPDGRVLAGLPDGTIGFVSISGDPGTDQLDEEVLAAAGMSLDELSYQFGVDLASLIESLSGDFTVAVTETRQSSIAEATDVPVGVVGALGLLDVQVVADFLDSLALNATEAGVDVSSDGDVTTFAEEGVALFGYSLGDDMLVVGTGSDLVTDVAAANGGLLDSALYKELDGAVIGEGLVFYVDIPRIVDLVPLTSDEAAVFAPLRGAGWGGRSVGDVAEMEMLLLVDY